MNVREIIEAEDPKNFMLRVRFRTLLVHCGTPALHRRYKIGPRETLPVDEVTNQPSAVVNVYCEGFGWFTVAFPVVIYGREATWRQRPTDPDLYIFAARISRSITGKRESPDWQDKLDGALQRDFPNDFVLNGHVKFH